ncbi:hypothetical protein M3P05_20320 [Sansalvadorimonas sp. 2012CJ34-2]|uniref:Lipoprotein n=1 Tax=Parendozoicomonas callyspongiae TaxID=2942213 RepID=A0ABT0PLM4_9GAMM|nr:hypothetical protein [Sansalvadorimonas sp. 2012CJ34-2]MCL6272268.1 hypothetical protein [Sansalvadorimonas sp. 2012CJ34-2]
MRLLAVILFSIFMAGCATPKYNYAPITTEISEPPIDSINVAYVGDTMLRQGKFTNHDAIYVRGKIDPSWAYSILPGYYLKQGNDSDSGFYYPSGGNESGSVTKAALADPWKSVQAYTNTNKICVITVFNVAACGNSNDFEHTQKPIQSKNSFQQTLIYSGIIGNKINIGYREFSSNMARPAFNNDVEYDLTKSKIIGYKGAKIEIVDATNELIKYRVIKNFNKAKY